MRNKQMNKLMLLATFAGIFANLIPVQKASAQTTPAVSIQEFYSDCNNGGGNEKTSYIKISTKVYTINGAGRSGSNSITLLNGSGNDKYDPSNPSNTHKTNLRNAITSKKDPATNTYYTSDTANRVIDALAAAEARMCPDNKVNVTGTLTADNHYRIYVGNSNGTDLLSIGRNEYGAGGNPGTFNWSKAETWDFTVDDNDYIYIVVWDDSSTDESWIGEFTANGETLLSKSSKWEYIITQSNNKPGDNGDVDSSAVADEISQATRNSLWSSSVRRGANGMSPWGTISDISSSADFLKVADRSSGKYTIFRTKVSFRNSLNNTVINSD
jgi:hypothetical protein